MVYRCVDPGQKDANGENTEQWTVCDCLQAHSQLKYGSQFLHDNNKSNANYTHDDDNHTHNPIDGCV